MLYHAIAILPGNKRKTIANKSEEQVLVQVVVPYISQGVIKTDWGSKTKSHQVIELRIYKTTDAWDKKKGQSIEQFLAGKRNIYRSLATRAQRFLQPNRWRCFIVMPIQGNKYGSDEERRIFAEYESRFTILQSLLAELDTAAIRIDKEYPLEELVARIKQEIGRADFVITDLTDERQSCYFEAGFAEALSRPVIYMAGKKSVLDPGRNTKIHFDIHRNVNWFESHEELEEKLRGVMNKNTELLFREAGDPPPTTPAFQ